jgi:quercetin dioxygenase-like cupin family protein
MQTQIRSSANVRTAVSAVLVCAAGFIAGSASGAQEPAVKRTVLQRTDARAKPQQEVIVVNVELEPGARTGRHRHHGTELGYIMEGEVVLERDGQAVATLKAGQSFRNDTVHNARNATRKPAKLLAVFIVDKGKPLTEAVR